jgi:hypothetical protein
MSAVEFLPPQGTSEEVCAWLFTLSDEMVRYFPAVVVGGIRGANIYNDPMEEIISHLAIVSEEHRTKISEVSPFCQLLHVCARHERIQTTLPPRRNQAPLTFQAISILRSQHMNRASQCTEEPIIVVVPSSTRASIARSRSSQCDFSSKMLAPDHMMSSLSLRITESAENTSAESAESGASEAEESEVEETPTSGGFTTLLSCPPETVGWVVLCEGFLRIKEARSTWQSVRGRLTSSQSKKICWCVLRVSPTTLEARLERYKGRAFKAGLCVTGASIVTTRPGHIDVRAAGGGPAWGLRVDSRDPQPQPWLAALQETAILMRIEPSKPRKNCSSYAFNRPN